MKGFCVHILKTLEHTHARNHTQLKMHTHVNDTAQSSKASDDEDDQLLTQSERQSAVLRDDTQTDPGQSQQLGRELFMTSAIQRWFDTEDHTHAREKRLGNLFYV